MFDVLKRKRICVANQKSPRASLRIHFCGAGCFVWNRSHGPFPLSHPHAQNTCSNLVHTNQITSRTKANVQRTKSEAFYSLHCLTSSYNPHPSHTRTSSVRRAYTNPNTTPSPQKDEGAQVTSAEEKKIHYKKYLICKTNRGSQIYLGGIKQSPFPRIPDP